MKFLLVSHSQKNGGAEKCLIELAEALVKRKHTVVVVLPVKAENYQLFKDIGCSIIIKSYPWWVSDITIKVSFFNKIRKNLSLLKSLFTFISIIATVRPNYILTNTICIPQAALISKLFNIKQFWFIHELGLEDHKLKYDYGINISTKIMSLCSTKIFVNSDFVLDYYSKYITKTKFKVIELNIPVENIKFKEPLHHIELVVIGQIQEAKCQLDAILAHEKLLILGYDSSLKIIGSETQLVYANQLKSIVDTNKIKDVEFINHQKNPYDLISKDSIALVCSDYEAFGRVTIEYMKLKIPIIAKAAGNTLFLIKDGHNGLLYNYNDIDLLVNKILYIKNNREEINNIILTAYNEVKNHYNESIYFNLIEEEFK
jgi:glycosyltransferase involved in cell wall biosynthesis